MLLLRDMVAAIVEQAGQRLASGLPVHTVLHAARQPGDQRGAFDQTLGVDNRVIFLCPYGVAKGLAFGPDGGRKPGFTPAANGDGNHPIHRFMPGRNLGEPFLDDPVKANAGKSLRGIGQRGQRMQDVAHGRGFYDQYPHPLRFLFIGFFLQERV